MPVLFHAHSRTAFTKAGLTIHVEITMARSTVVDINILASGKMKSDMAKDVPMFRARCLVIPPINRICILANGRMM